MGRPCCRLSAIIVIATVASACGSRADSHGRPPRLGYTSERFERQRSLEQRFRDSVSSDRLSSFHADLTRRTHTAGTPGARAVADYLERSLASFGLDVKVFEYQAYLSLPRDVAVEIVAPRREPLRVVEPPSELDADTHAADLTPGYVAYCASGDVTAPGVYVNYGLPPDYAELAKRHIDVKGKIVVARYGRSHRAVKLHTAEQAGARGIILYSDPADDGFARGETWPQGFWRTADQLQRGNAKYSWFWHGGALTPGQPALADVAGLDPATAPTLPRIPAVVLSWGEARRLLERLGGAAVPPPFQGALPFTYRFGDETVQVHLRVQMDDGRRPIRNVVARV